MVLCAPWSLDELFKTGICRIDIVNQCPGDPICTVFYDNIYYIFNTHWQRAEILRTSLIAQKGKILVRVSVRVRACMCEWHVCVCVRARVCACMFFALTYIGTCVRACVRAYVRASVRACVLVDTHIGSFCYSTRIFDLGLFVFQTK